MRIRFEGIDNFAEKLEELEIKASSLAKSTLYEGAKVMADEVKRGLQAIPIDIQKYGSRKGYAPFIHQGSNGRMITGVTPRQKQDIINSMGISRMREEGGNVSVRIGFDGYTVDGKGENEIAIAMLLRSFESGTSFIKKAPIVRKAFASGRPKVKEAMQKHIDRVIKESFG